MFAFKKRLRPTTFFNKIEESVFNSDRKNPLDVAPSVSLVNPFFKTSTIKSLPPLPYTQAAKINY